MENEVYSLCFMCSVRCPIKVQVKDGQVRWIEGNPLVPGMEGSLCPRGAAGINMLYDFGDDYIAFDPPEHYGVSVRVDGNDDFVSGVERGCQLKVYYYTGGKAAQELSNFGSVKALYR